MPEYDNNMSGVLFKNDKKQSEKSPEYKGQAEVDGQEYWLSAWIKEGKKGKFMSLSFKLKEENGGKKETAKTEPQNNDGDEIPF